MGGTQHLGDSLYHVRCLPVGRLVNVAYGPPSCLLLLIHVYIKHCAKPKESRNHEGTKMKDVSRAMLVIAVELKRQQRCAGQSILTGMGCRWTYVEGDDSGGNPALLFFVLSPIIFFILCYL